jgi:hypothetical protein
MAKKTTTEGTESKGFRPSSDLSEILATAKVNEKTSIFVNEAGEFHWNENFAKKLWIENRESNDLEPIEFEEVSIETLTTEAAASKTAQA